MKSSLGCGVKVSNQVFRGKVSTGHGMLHSAFEAGVCRGWGGGWGEAGRKGGGRQEGGGGQEGLHASHAASTMQLATVLIFHLSSLRVRVYGSSALGGSGLRV